MGIKTEIIVVKELLDRDELTEEQKADLVAATKVREFAYANRSHFKVGAAIRMNDGAVFEGWNVENIVYKGIHAEENAIGKMDPHSRDSGIKCVTVVGAPEGDDDYSVPTGPCGICRQFLLEFVKKEENPEVIMAGIKGAVLKMFLKDQLLEAFYPAVLVN